VTGGLASVWLVMLGIATGVHPGERFPLAGMAGRPIRRK
jgi:hypothetical protein